VHLEDVYLSIVEGSQSPRRTRDVGQGDLT